MNGREEKDDNEGTRRNDGRRKHQEEQEVCSQNLSQALHYLLHETKAFCLNGRNSY